MCCVHEVEVEWVHALSYLRRSLLGGVEPSRIAVCWSSEWEDQEQRSNLRGTRVRLWMAGVGAMVESVEFVTHDFVGEARGVIALVI